LTNNYQNTQEENTEKMVIEPTNPHKDTLNNELPADIYDKLAQIFKEEVINTLVFDQVDNKDQAGNKSPKKEKKRKN